MLSSLLHFAYLESMGLWIVPYSIAGLLLASIAATRVQAGLRLPCTAFILALFFSLSVVVGRMAVPIPTLFAIGLWTVDTLRFAVDPSLCRSSGDGCPQPGPGLALIMVPLVVQGLLLYAVLAAGSWLSRKTAR